MANDTPDADIRHLYMPLVQEKLTNVFHDRAVDHFKFEYLATGRVERLVITFEDESSFEIVFSRDPESEQLTGCVICGYPLVDVPLPAIS